MQSAVRVWSDDVCDEMFSILNHQITKSVMDDVCVELLVSFARPINCTITVRMSGPGG